MVDNERAKRDVATMKREHERAKTELMRAVNCLKNNDEAAAVKTLAAVQNALIAHVGREKRSLDEVANKSPEFKAIYAVSQAALEKILVMAVEFFKNVANGGLRGKEMEAQLNSLSTALIARIAEEEKAGGIYDKYIKYHGA